MREAGLVTQTEVVEDRTEEEPTEQVSDDGPSSDGNDALVESRNSDSELAEIERESLRERER